MALGSLETQIVERAQDIIAKLKAMDADSSLPGGKPNVLGGGGFDAVDHQGYRDKLVKELIGYLKILKESGVDLDDNGNVVSTVGVHVTQGILGG